MKFWFLVLLVLIAKDGLHGAEPTVQPSNITFSNRQCDAITITWTNGDGAWRLMLVREGSAVNAVPVDGVKSYTAFSKFGLGTNVGSGNYVCFNNTTNSITLTGLKQNTTYYIALFEHDNLSPDYLTSIAATASFTTENININANFTYSDSCQRNNSYTFHNLTTATFGPLQFQWDFGNNVKLKADSAVYTYDTGGVFNITLSIINARGCKNVFVLPKKLVCYSQPKSSIVEKNNDTVQCLEGNNFTMINKSTIDNIPNTSLLGKWYFPNGDTNSNKTINISFKNAGYQKVKLINETYFFNHRTGCIDSLDYYLRVVNNPGNDVVINDSVQCFKNNLFTFKNISPSFSKGTWYFGDGDSAKTKNTSHSYSNKGSYNIIYQGETIEGCKSLDTFNILVKDNKDASFSTTKDIYCLNESPITLSPKVDPNGTFYGKNVVNNEFIPLDSGNYSITYIVSDTVCPDTQIKLLTIKPLPYFKLRDSSICNSGNVIYTLSAGNSVLWENGDTNRTRAFNQTGTYSAISTLGGCTFSDSFYLYVGTAPVLNFPSDTTLCKDQIFNLTITASPGTQFNWSNGNTSNSITTTLPQILTLTAKNGCGSSTKSINIHYLLENCDLFIPNAFSPNSNNKNETFNIIPRNPLIIKSFNIYNRWGNLVYSMDPNKPTQGWDGKYRGLEAIEGVYIYNIIYQTGIEPNISQNNIKGTFHLLR